MRSITSSVSRATVSIAARFSFNCPTFDAPRITVLTFGFLRHQAIASCAGVHPSSPESATISFARGDLRATLVGVDRTFLEPVVLGERHPRVLGDAVLVLAGQHTRGERGPDRRPEPDTPVQRVVLTLEAVTMEHVVLRLLHRGRCQAELTGDTVRLLDLLRTPFRGAPVEHPALPDQRVHRPNGLLDRRLEIGPVAEEQIEVLQLEALQRRVTGVHHMLAVQATLGRQVAAPIDLARDAPGVAAPTEVLQRLAHDLLGLTSRVDLGVVEEIHAAVVGRAHDFLGLLDADLERERDPGSEGESADLEARASEAPIFHETAPVSESWDSSVNPAKCPSRPLGHFLRQGRSAPWRRSISCIDHGGRMHSWSRAGIAICILLIAGGVSTPAQTQFPFAPALNRSVRVVHVVLEDNGDGDGWADSNETVSMRLRLLNAAQIDLTRLRAQLSSDDPSVECITRPFIFVGDVAIGEERLTEAAFEFKLAEVDRPQDGSVFTAAFSIRFSADEYGGAMPGPQEIVLELDLDAGSEMATTTFLESFENGLGSFEPQPIDEMLNPPDGDLENDAAGVINADGYRCQYSNPDWQGALVFGSPQAGSCYPNPDNQPDRFWWTTTTDRAFSGSGALRWNTYLDPTLGFTTPTAQLEAVRSADPINLAPNRICDDSEFPCSEDSDCAEGDTCRPPRLSFKHQISLLDHRSISHNADKGIVQVQAADARGVAAGPWIKLRPYVNIYDTLPASNFFNCSFDPIDDGNTEDDYFDPADPFRSRGPSSTCAPEFNFVHQGETGLQFDVLKHR